MTSSGDEIGTNENVTLDGVWHSCEINDQRIRYERGTVDRKIERE